MADEDLKKLQAELAKLPAEERIKKLKEFEEKRKAEAKKVEDILKQSIDDARKEQETKVKTLIERMGKKAADTQPEKPREVNLEQTVAESKVQLTDQQLQQIRYGVPKDFFKDNANPEVMGNNAVYGRIKEIRNKASQGYISQSDAAFLQEFEDGMQNMQNQYVSSSQTRENLLRAEYALKQIEQYKTSAKGQTLKTEER